MYLPEAKHSFGEIKKHVDKLEDLQVRKKSIFLMLLHAFFCETRISFNSENLIPAYGTFESCTMIHFHARPNCFWTISYAKKILVESKMRQRSIFNDNSFRPEKNSIFPKKKYLETFQKDFFSPGPGVWHPPRSPLQRDLRPHREDQEAGGAGWGRQDHQECFLQFSKICCCFFFQSMTSGTPPTTLSRLTSRHVCVETFPKLAFKHFVVSFCDFQIENNLAWNQNLKFTD